MPLGTMILRALITPKSSFPSLSLSFSVSLSSPKYNMQTHTSTHTHTHWHTNHMLRPAHRNTPELAAELVICDAVWLGGRGEFGSISVCPHPSFIPLHIFPRGMNDFHITTVEADHIRLHAVIQGVLEQNFLEWRNGVIQFLKDRSFLFFFSSRHIGKKQTDGKEVKRQTGGQNKTNRAGYIYACVWASEQPLVQSVHHSRCVSVLSFIMAARELALLLPYVTKLLITTSILIIPRQLQAHLQHSSTCCPEWTVY